MTYSVNYTVDRDELFEIEIEEYDYARIETVVMRATKKFSPVRTMKSFKVETNNTGQIATDAHKYITYLEDHCFAERVSTRVFMYNNLWHSKGAKVK